MKVHDLKCWPEEFQAVYDGLKTYEIRKDDGRNFEVGDFLRLNEWDPKTQKHTGRSCMKKIMYITKGGEWGIPHDMVVMAIQ